jgi:hypothetical protein
MSRALPTFIITAFSEAVDAIYRIRDELNRVLRRMDHDGIFIGDSNAGPAIMLVAVDPRQSPGKRAARGSLAVVFGSGTGAWYKKIGDRDEDWVLTTI